MASVQGYLDAADVNKLLASLTPGNADFLRGQVEHFTVNEAEHRDEIVLGYFGEAGLERLVTTIAGKATKGTRTRAPAVLDVGSGVGTFTIPIMSRVKKASPKATFYAMDLTPALLRIIAKKSADILPFVGVAENVLGSVREARRHLAIPESFDVILSTLMLHHCPDITRVFQSLRQVMGEGGTTIIADMCSHSFSEFRDEMGDYHLGFEPDAVKRTAGNYFRDVRVEVVEGLCCSSSGRSAEIFVLTMKK